jgi:hypothetical protein
MTREDLVKWAREAGFMFCEESYKHQHNCLFYGGYAVDEQLERFAALVRADEREACAKVCETKLGPTATDFYGKTYAAAIRARGQS